MAKILVTGGAGFIGSHLVDALLARGDEVVVLDNLSNGRLSNIEHVLDRIHFIDGDLRDRDVVHKAMEGVERVSHHGALGSVPRSINDPQTSNDVNVGGTLNVLVAARDAGVKRVVNISSSSIYGNTPVLPKHEGMPLNPLSPYALTKATAEEYARIFHLVYGLSTITLRYFNVFGPRQNPKAAYAAVIPLFISAVLKGERPTINGDGSNSRDFTYVANVVHANLLALDGPDSAAGRSYNVGLGGQVTLLELMASINEACGTSIEPIFAPPRAGDVDHSRAAVDDLKAALGFEPVVVFDEGIRLTVEALKKELPSS